ncbi:MAG: efflux RND transporter periplasmic adaptor subunit [Spirochaetia bacterium]|nr:efflux RND transporter periplasmic adaptor subunit [Spirochaetia bacterium]
MIPTVNTLVLKKKNLRHEIKRPGTVRIMEKAVVSSKIQGRISETFFEKGDTVKRGDILCELETFDLIISMEKAKSNLSSARSALAQSRARYSRSRKNAEKEIKGLDKLRSEIITAHSDFIRSKNEYRNKMELYKIGGISRHELIRARTEYISTSGKFYQTKKQLQISSVGFRNKDLSDSLKKQNRIEALIESNSEIEKSGIDAARAAYKNALLEVKHAGLYLKESKIRSPIDGIIADRKASAGEEVSRGDPVFSVFNNRRYIVSVQIAESEFENIKLRQDAECEIGNNKSGIIKGAVSRIAPLIDPSSRMSEIGILIENPEGKIIPGMFARCRLLIREKKNALAVPENFVIAKEDESKNRRRFVFSVKNRTAIEVPVVTGETFGNEIEILSGLSEGDQIITDRLLIIKDGSKIAIKSRKSETQILKQEKKDR